MLWSYLQKMAMLKMSKTISSFLIIGMMIINGPAVADDFEQEWRQQKQNFNLDNFTKITDENGQMIDLKQQTESKLNTEMLDIDQNEADNFANATKDKEMWELENQARQARMQNTETNQVLDQLTQNSNPNAPGMKAHEEKAIAIAKEADELIKNSITAELKKHDIDINCINVPGTAHLRDDQLVVGLKPENIKDEVYEPKYCEHLRNVYDLKDDLEIHCLQFSQRPENLQIQSANFKYEVKGNLMTMHQNYEFLRRGQYYGSQKGFFKAGGFLGSKKDVYYNLHGTNLHMTFNVALDPDVFKEFQLKNISSNGYMIVRLNNVTIYPNNYYQDLYDTGRTHEEAKYSGNFVKSTKTTHNYPIISYGHGDIQIGHGGGNKTSSIDLRPQLKKGYNVLEIKSFGQDGGQFSAQIESYERICLKWSEPIWNESWNLRQN
jgi:hypothetical protein